MGAQEMKAPAIDTPIANGFDVSRSANSGSSLVV
jgi:hypothetical protein